MSSEALLNSSLPHDLVMGGISLGGSWQLRISLPKETKDLYTENYKTLMKEIKNDTNRRRNTPCSWIGRINIVKMNIYPKSIERLNAIPIKLPKVFFRELEQIISQLVWKHKKP